MRFFRTFGEAQNEIKRDLAELSLSNTVPPMYQSKDVAGQEGFETLELMNYGFTVTRPDWRDLEDVHQAWFDQEWEDRLTGDLNPGIAWRRRPELWRPLLENYVNDHHPGGFSYTYSIRMGGSKIQKIIDEIKKHPYSRQLYLPVWWQYDLDKLGVHRVPCSLGYWFVNRGGELHMTYMMRSCDFVNHWPNDVGLAARLLELVAGHSDLGVGQFTQFVGSLHIYRKDVEGVF